MPRWFGFIAEKSNISRFYDELLRNKNKISVHQRHLRTLI